MNIVLKQSLLAAFVALVFEYVVYLNLYKRSKKLEQISLIVAPGMAFIAVYLSYVLFGYVSPLTVFTLAVLMELPLSLKGYEISPDETLPNRLVVAGIGITLSFLIARYFIN
jgi:hypothetical protein